MRGSSGSRIVVLTLCGFLVVLLLLCINQFVLQGLIMPIRVIGGSMAERFYGPHYAVCCNDCRFTFAIDATTIPKPRFVDCPNCGSHQPHNPLQPVVAGDRLLIDCMSFQLRDPDRWETILFQSIDPALDHCLKRVVGLPDETLAVASGDIWVNGKRLKKDFATADAMAITVHDARFAAQHAGIAQRWRPKHQASQWQRMPQSTCGFKHVPRPPSEDQTALVDWIVYDHVDLHRGQYRVVDRVTDNYAYNQTLSRKLYKTDDLLLAAKIQWHGKGRLFFELGSLRLELDCGQATGKLREAGQGLAEFFWPARQAGSVIRVEVASVDQQFFFVINKEVIFSCDLEVARIDRAVHAADEALGDNHTRSDRLLAIGAQSLHATIEHPLVRRDVYYTPEVRGIVNRRTGEYHLAADEFFVLGDNSPISLDSRQNTDAAIVRRGELLGRVWRWR
ncbi:MAG: hypothetical protein CMJ74_12480 [Planctomycetaceae bacterium]|nr:hypothetical protein [Planctomycetaceae bacterium]